jgi:hypothetical protein
VVSLDASHSCVAQVDNAYAAAERQDNIMTVMRGELENWEVMQRDIASLTVSVDRSRYGVMLFVAGPDQHAASPSGGGGEGGGGAFVPPRESRAGHQAVSGVVNAINSASLIVWLQGELKEEFDAFTRNLSLEHAEYRQTK